MVVDGRSVLSPVPSVSVQDLYVYVVFWGIFILPNYGITVNRAHLDGFCEGGGRRVFPPTVSSRKDLIVTLGFKWITTALVRSTPETFVWLGVSLQSAVCPKKALLADIGYFAA